MSTPEFDAALARLDAEIAEAEARLADLRLKRKGAEAFREYMRETTPSARPPRKVTVPVPQRRRPSHPHPEADRYATPPSDAVEAVLAKYRGEGVVWSIDKLWDAVIREGHEISRDQLRNGLYYLSRKRQVENVGRGTWRVLTDAEGPVAAGPSDGNTRPVEEGGGSRETTEAPASAAEDQRHPQLGASITEVAS